MVDRDNHPRAGRIGHRQACSGVQWLRIHGIVGPDRHDGRIERAESAMLAKTGVCAVSPAISSRRPSRSTTQPV